MIEPMILPQATLGQRASSLATIVAEAMLQRKASKSRGLGIRFRLLKKNPHLVSAVK